MTLVRLKPFRPPALSAERLSHPWQWQPITRCSTLRTWRSLELTKRAHRALRASWRNSLDHHVAATVAWVLPFQLVLAQMLPRLCNHKLLQAPLPAMPKRRWREIRARSRWRRKQQTTMLNERKRSKRTKSRNRRILQRWRKRKRIRRMKIRRRKPKMRRARLTRKSARRHHKPKILNRRLKLL